MSESITVFSFSIGSFKINITQDIVMQWIVIAILGIVAFLLTRNLKRVPNKKQVVLEIIYNYISGLVDNNMGQSFVNYIPYVGTLVVYLLALNFMGAIGISPPTQNLSVTAGLALISFLVINGTAIIRNGPIGYARGLTKPFALMLPINIMERVTLPVSLALRLFGNMMAATVLVDMVYDALGSLNWFAQLALPIPVHAYFDLFDGTIQMLVFTMLTINYIKLVSDEH